LVLAHFMPSRHPVVLTVCLHATPPPVIYSLSLHDALPISGTRESYAPVWRRAALFGDRGDRVVQGPRQNTPYPCPDSGGTPGARSEEHTSELQSRENLVCRLLLEKKKEKLVF